MNAGITTSSTYFLQHWNDRRLDLLEEVKHHQDVRIGGQGSPWSITNVTQLSKILHCISKALEWEGKGEKNIKITFLLLIFYSFLLFPYGTFSTYLSQHVNSSKNQPKFHKHPPSPYDQYLHRLLRASYFAMQEYCRERGPPQGRHDEWQTSQWELWLLWLQTHGYTGGISSTCLPKLQLSGCDLCPGGVKEYKLWAHLTGKEYA